MRKSAAISARVDPELKQSVERVFDALGLNTTEAITLFFKQVELQQGLPFSVKIPNEATKSALESAQARSGLTSFDTTDELFEDLGIE